MVHILCFTYFSKAHSHVFPVPFKANISGKLQYKSECRMEAIFLESLFVEQIGAVVDRTIPRPPPPAVVVLRYFYNTYNIFRISLQCGVRATLAEFHFKATGAVVLPRQKILHLTFNITLHCLSYGLSIFINPALKCSLGKAHDRSNIMFRTTERPRGYLYPEIKLYFV